MCAGMKNNKSINFYAEDIFIKQVFYILPINLFYN